MPPSRGAESSRSRDMVSLSFWLRQVVDMLRVMRNLIFATTLAIVSPSSMAHLPSGMTAAANAFLGSLPAGQRDSATFSLESPDRIKWHYLPAEMFPRGGVVLRDLGPEQRAHARRLLESGLSQRGLLAADAIMELENVVRELGLGQRFARDPSEYYVSVFGTPDAHGTWGWRFEGHHLSLHFTIVAGHITVSTPTFMGTNPAELREGPRKGQRPLGPQEDHARALIQSLSEQQRGIAVLADTAPAEIITANNYPVGPLTPAGIAATALASHQQEMLKTLIESYASLMATEIAAARLARVYDSGFEDVAFAWMGSMESGQPHYYRVQGPTFLIEYDNTQNNANHVHAVWRDFHGDFGDDLLREHYRTDTTHMQDFATRYTAAWCSQDPASVAAFFSENGSLQINDGEPSVGRAAITEAARSFMRDLPDMVVEMNALERADDGYIYRWTLTGTNTGPGGTGRKVRISGYEEWSMGTDGLVARSLGHLDAADYNRQLGR